MATSGWSNRVRAVGAYAPGRRSAAAFEAARVRPLFGPGERRRGAAEAATGRDGPDRPASPVGAFGTADGWLSISVFTDAQWRRLAAAIERPDLTDDDRFATAPARLANDRELVLDLQRTFATRSSADWIATLARHDLPAEELRSYGDFLREPQLAESGLLSWIEDPALGRVPVVAGQGGAWLEGLSAPLAGADGADILSELDGACDK